MTPAAAEMAGGAGGLGVAVTASSAVAVSRWRSVIENLQRLRGPNSR